MGSLRFFAQQIEAGGGLHVYALVQTANGVQTVPVARLLDGSMPSWAPTQPITGDTENLSDDQTLQVALEFSVRAWSASWQIDDVYVDPYRSG
jgi:hypothetical protein